MEKLEIFRQIKAAHSLLIKKQYRNATHTIGILIASMEREDKAFRQAHESGSFPDEENLIGYIKDDFENKKEVFIPANKGNDH